MDGNDLRLIDSNGFTSHFIWRDATHILAYAGWDEQISRFQVFEDKTNKAEAIDLHEQAVAIQQKLAADHPDAAAAPDGFPHDSEDCATDGRGDRSRPPPRPRGPASSPGHPADH